MPDHGVISIFNLIEVGSSVPEVLNVQHHVRRAVARGIIITPHYYHIKNDTRKLSAAELHHMMYLDPLSARFMVVPCYQSDFTRFLQTHQYSKLVNPGEGFRNGQQVEGLSCRSQA